MVEEEEFRRDLQVGVVSGLEKKGGMVLNAMLCITRMSKINRWTVC